MKKVFKFIILGVSVFAVSGVTTYFLTNTRVVDTLTPAQKEFNKLVNSMSNMKSVDGNIETQLKIDDNNVRFDSPIQVSLKPNLVDIKLNGNLTINNQETIPVNFVSVNHVNYIDINEKKIKFTNDDIKSFTSSLEEIGFPIQETLNKIQKMFNNLDFSEFTSGIVNVPINGGMYFYSTKVKSLNLYCDNEYNLSKIVFENFQENNITGNLTFTCATDHQKEILISSPEQKEGEYFNLSNYKDPFQNLAAILSKGSSGSLIQKLSLISSYQKSEYAGNIKLNINFFGMSMFDMDSSYVINLDKNNHALKLVIKDIPLSDINYDLKEEEEGLMDVSLIVENGNINVKKSFVINEQTKTEDKTYQMKEVFADPLNFIFGSIFNFKNEYIQKIKEIGFVIPSPSQVNDLINSFKNKENQKWELDLNLKTFIESELIEPSLLITFDSEQADSPINKIITSMKVNIASLLDIDFAFTTNIFEK